MDQIQAFKELKRSLEGCGEARRRLAIKQKSLFKKIESDKFSKSERQELKKIFYDHFPQSEMSISMVPDVRFGAGDSYVSSVVGLIKIKRIMRSLGVNILPGGNDKRKDAEFARRMGIPVPSVYQREVPFEEIDLSSGSVVKPCSGSSSLGVFVVSDNSLIRSVKTKNSYRSLLEAFCEAKRYKNKISLNRWIREELVTLNGKAANDFKVYSFYGESALFLEMDRSGDKNKYCWYDSSLKKIDFPLSERYLDFEGTGVPEQLVGHAQMLSQKYPSPFVRLDFLKGDAGLYLGEVTPHPGRYYGGMPSDLDAELGGFFNRAWARLMIDLIKGKKFDEYFEVYQS